MTAHGGKAGQLAFSSAARLRPWEGASRHVIRPEWFSKCSVHYKMLRSPGFQAIVVHNSIRVRRTLSLVSGHLPSA